MYIGPWQEYALYRAQKATNLDRNTSKVAVSTNEKLINTLNHDDLKKELQRAFLSSLDEASAKKAMEAMDSIIENLSDNITLQSEVSVSTSVTSTHYRLPPLHTQPLKDKSSSTSRTILSIPNRNISTPKSSASDPLPSIHFYDKTPPKRFINTSASQLPMISTQRSPASSGETRARYSDYDSRSVMAMIRKERASKLIEASKTPSTWQWSTSNEPPKSTIHRKLEGRLKELHRMKALYIAQSSRKALPSIESSIADSESAALSSSAESVSISPSIVPPIESINTPQAKKADEVGNIIVDLELTSSDFDIVSKYFDFPLSTKLSSPVSSVQPTSHTGAMHDRISASQTDIKTTTDHMMIPSQEFSKAMHNKRQDVVTPAFQPVPYQGLDDLYAGGVDGGLINWCLGLSLDPPI